jgi:hypothetical protein
VSAPKIPVVNCPSWGKSAQTAPGRRFPCQNLHLDFAGTVGDAGAINFTVRNDAILVTEEGERRHVQDREKFASTFHNNCQLDV